MSSKKKLSLGPLPEQREDYSQYQEEVVRWDRIIIAGIAALVLLLALISLFIGDSEEESQSLQTKVEENRSEEEPETPIAKKTITNDKVEIKSANNVSIVNEKSELNQTGEKPVLKELNAKSDKSERSAIESNEQATNADIAVDKPKTASSVLTTKQVEKEALPEPALIVDQASLRPASVLITNSSIKEAVLNLSTDKGLPGEVIKHSIVMPAKGLIKVMLTTEMHGMKGKKLFHEWYRNGKRQARVRIPVNIDSQISHSSKFIDKYMLGQWKVKVVDSTGEPYVLADFEVISAK